MSPRPALVQRTDLLLAGVLLVLGQGELALGEGPAEWWRFVLAGLGTLPLVWRRRAPLTVLLVVVAPLCALTAMREDTFTVAHLVAMMVMAYTVAAADPAGVAGVGLLLALAAAVLNVAAARSTEPGDYVFAVILLGTPWLAGLGVRRWRTQAEEMRELARQLDAERGEHGRLVVAAERGRIARDLHDSLAQALNAVVVHAEAAEEALDRDGERVRHSLRRIQEVGRTSLAETRELLHILRSPDAGAVRLKGLTELDTLVASYRGEGLRIELDRRGHSPCSPAVEATAYRIVQESLTNVLRHAPGSTVHVCIEQGPVLVLEVRDDGVGASPAEAPGAGYGLVGMRERVGLLGGTLRAGPEGGGFLVRAMLPSGVRS